MNANHSYSSDMLPTVIGRRSTIKSKSTRQLGSDSASFSKPRTKGRFVMMRLPTVNVAADRTDRSPRKSSGALRGLLQWLEGSRRPVESVFESWNDKVRLGRYRRCRKG